MLWGRTLLVCCSPGLATGFESLVKFGKQVVYACETNINTVLHAIISIIITITGEESRDGLPEISTVEGLKLCT